MRNVYSQREPRLSSRERVVAVVEQGQDMAQWFIDERRLTPRERREQLRAILAMPTLLIRERVIRPPYRRVGRRKHNGRMGKRR